MKRMCMDTDLNIGTYSPDVVARWELRSNAVVRLASVSHRYVRAAGISNSTLHSERMHVYDFFYFKNRKAL